MKDPIYLIDGSGYIFRAFYAVRPLATSAGLPTNAVLGFTKMLVKLLREVKAKKIAVAFDVSRDTFRSKMYSDYKANRIACPDELLVQMPYFRKVVAALGVQCFEQGGYEADDVIATLAKKFSSQNEQVIIVSGDKDLTQLVSDGISVWDAMRDVVYDRAKVKEKFGVFPEQIIDYLSLTGDSSDNIPGVKGIGDKTAQILVNHFGNLEKLLENTEEIERISSLKGARGVREKIESGQKQLELSRQLVLLNESVSPFCEMKDSQSLIWHGINKNLMSSLFEELEFHSLRETLELSSETAEEHDIYADKNFVLVNENYLNEFISRISSVKEFAFDTETNSLDCLQCKLLGISFSWVKNEAYYLPLYSANASDKVLDGNRVREVLNPILKSQNIKKSGFNLKFDLQVLEAHGFEVNGVDFDSMICAHLLSPERRVGGLKDLAGSVLGEEMLEYDTVVGGKTSLAEAELLAVSQYACHDAESSWNLKCRLSEMLIEKGQVSEVSLAKAFYEVEMPLVKVLSDVERYGVKVDVNLLSALGKEWMVDMENLQQEIYKHAGMEFNLNSPKQVGEVLFEKLNIPTKGVRKTKSGFSTDAEVLNYLAPRYEIASLMLDYRELQKLNSTYVDSLIRLLNPKTNRIHTSYNQAITVTGRLSSSNPNLQNIPIRNERGRRLRDVFVAEQGCMLVSADYSQIELRVLAHLSGDESMKEAFIAEDDIHRRTAIELFGESARGDSSFRRIAKVINFGIIYGMGPNRLADELSISRKEAREYIDQYFARYPKVSEYFQLLKHQVDEHGFVTTMHGRRRYLSDIDISGRDAGYASRSLMNAPIQGSAAEIMKLAMINLHRKLAGYKEHIARMVLQVHDELVVEVSNDILSEVKQIVISEMENAITLDVPLKVDVRVGRSWGGG